MEEISFEQRVKKLIFEEYKKIKESSETFGEMKERQEKFLKGIIWSNKYLGIFVKEKMENLIAQDLREVKIEHPPK